nr:type II toxin-antitoxin system RelE/ParE family toxin [Prevotella sp.]
MNSEDEREDNLRELIFTEEFFSFYQQLDTKVQTKFDYTIEVVRNVNILTTNFVKHLEGTELYEMRVSVGSNAYRTIMFTMDHDNINLARRIILLNAFLKKSTKDYKKQVKIATDILKRLSDGKY